jgi:uncharacterized PurR-regulated membrane protein YhhQ (DUF165 family)
LSYFLVALYLGAVITANLLSAHFGPSISIVNAFFLIGLTLTVRDRAHDLFEHHRFWKLAALILAGSVVSLALGAGRVAIASAVAFAVAEGADAILYHAMRRWRWLARSNGSNLLGAALDSLIFPTIAFGGVLWAITGGQFLAKFAGGFLFSLLLVGLRRPREAA